MNANNGICKQIGHDQFSPTHICVYDDCRLKSRICCTQCLKQKTHIHSNKDSTYIIPLKTLIAQKKKEFVKLYQDQDEFLFQKILPKELQLCKKLIKMLQNKQSFIEQQIFNIQKNRQRIEKIIFHLTEQNFNKLDDQQIAEILNLNIYQSLRNQAQFIKPIQKKIDIKIDKLEIILKDYQNRFNEVVNPVDLNERKYVFKHIDQSELAFYTSSISNNEQYLAYGGKSKLLKIYDLMKDKIIKEIKMEIIKVCQFTEDSSQLYVGCDSGYVYGYNVQKYFKAIFRLQIHKDVIFSLRTIKNQYLITSSIDKTIRKTDIKSNKQIFRLIGAQSMRVIDYNQIDDMVISGSSETIKLWRCKDRRIIINKKKSHPIGIAQIQLINNNKNLLSLDFSANLYKWIIDLIQKDLIRIQELQDPNKIFNFNQINQDKNLIQICGKYIKILNNQGETIITLDHLGEGEQNFLFGECKQLNNGRYIQIRFSFSIMLAITQN